MGIDERPAVLAGAVLHDVVQALGGRIAFARLGLAQEEVGQHGHARAWVSGQMELPSSSRAIGG